MPKRSTILGVTEIVEDAYEAAKSAADVVIGGKKRKGPDFVLHFEGKGFQLDLKKYRTTGAAQSLKLAQQRFPLGPVYAGHTVFIHGKTGTLLGSAIVVTNPSNGEYEEFLSKIIAYSAEFTALSPFRSRAAKSRRTAKSRK